MKIVQLIHGKTGDIKERIASLRAAGFKVIDEPLRPGLLRRWKLDPPSAVVIDLSRAPSLGRDIAAGIRSRKATRHIPVIFAGGDPEKVAGIRELLPDAVYTSWEGIRGALRQAIAHPPASPVKPRSVLAGYAATPLAKKLGIKAGSVVNLVEAPPDFREILSDLPHGARLYFESGGKCDLTLWFVRSGRDLERGMAWMAKTKNQEPLWVLWPKKISRLASDVSQQQVRQTGMDAGMVDYKICSVDATWSGLLFKRSSA